LLSVSASSPMTASTMSPFHFTRDFGDKVGCTGIGHRYPKRMESKTDARLEFLGKFSESARKGNPPYARNSNDRHEMRRHKTSCCHQEEGYPLVQEGIAIKFENLKFVGLECIRGVQWICENKVEHTPGHRECLRTSFSCKSNSFFDNRSWHLSSGVVVGLNVDRKGGLFFLFLGLCADMLSLLLFIFWSRTEKFRLNNATV
jgi:hypothetical protein